MTDQNRSSASVNGQAGGGPVQGASRPVSLTQPGAIAPAPLSPPAQSQPPQLQGLVLQNSLRPQPLPSRPPLSPLGVNGVGASVAANGSGASQPNSSGTDSPTGASSASKRRPQAQAQVKRPTADQILDYRALVAQQAQLQMDEQHVAFANIYQVARTNTSPPL